LLNAILGSTELGYVNTLTLALEKTSSFRGQVRTYIPMPQSTELSCYTLMPRSMALKQKWHFREKNKDLYHNGSAPRVMTLRYRFRFVHKKAKFSRTPRYMALT
jgi:hypothetical protein